MTFSEMRAMRVLKMRLRPSKMMIDNFILRLKKSMKVATRILEATDEKPMKIPSVDDHFSDMSS